MKRVGLDIGSTTVKCVMLDEEGKIVFSSYERHLSHIKETASALLLRVAEETGCDNVILSVSGSAGMGLATELEIPFVQEVFATRTAVKRLIPDTDVVIELGGEDAKILFLSGVSEVRMNGTCAGGTGAFIDQMAALMNITPSELNTLAKDHEKIYTIASRCGVFAKTDVQPLINQGARLEDVSASILYAVVNQTVGGLAQGREIEGKILYLGGPLTFFSELRAAFDDTLKLCGTLPENSLYFVAIGAALSSSAELSLVKTAEKIASFAPKTAYQSCKPLFESEEDYRLFKERHAAASKNIRFTKKPSGKMYLGIDAGSTTVKAVLCDCDGNLYKPFYTSNSGNPVPLIKKYLEELYSENPDIEIAGSAVTGYGEDIIKNAFKADIGIVETVAHYTAAKRFCPDVDFIMDIGGQDIKCFKIKNGAVDSIFLNEACSSGCGSFLQTFAKILGMTAKEFSLKALYAERPVDLGSRCTVFMNSSVKQAQKDGAGVENISAGLSISVVKNALYKVIRCADCESLGKNIVVQGGTFNNDAVLRAFEQEIGRNVIRPSVAGLMGAYGAALYAMRHASGEKSTLLDASALKTFTHTVKAVTCNGCTNHCKLTVNTFSGGEVYIAGNRCERPLKTESKEYYDLYEYKNSLLDAFRRLPQSEGKKTVGIPLGLNMYELLPFWATLFYELGFNVAVSSPSSHALYRKGQHTIPSDTVCYPAKLMHGHIEDLLDRGCDMIFYPSMSYNTEEGKGQNHYNCPVVAYYPEVINANVKRVHNTVFVNGFIGVHDKKEFIRHFPRMMSEYGFSFGRSEVKAAAEKAYHKYAEYLSAVRQKADEFIAVAKEKNMPVIVLSGRPYHIDGEINHGIDRLICELGAVVITEDSVAYKIEKFPTTVLNQWTFHSRLYAAAKYVGEQNDVKMELVQLVSFGCGVDAVTTDEVRSILESRGKLYTGIKIDEITNLGAVKIRLRSLFALDDRL